MRFGPLMFLLLLSSLSATAQDSIMYKRYLEVGLSANAYRGDLQSSYEKFSSGAHLAVQWMKKKRVNGAFNLHIGSITGQNPDYKYSGSDERTTPNRYFKTNIITLHYEVQVNLLKRPNYRIFVSQGLGIIRFNVRNDQKQDLSKDLTSRPEGETYGNLAFILPTQIGAQYFLSNGLGVGYKMGWYNPTTDYLDNISQWGNRSGNDKIFVARFSVIVPVRLKSEK